MMHLWAASRDKVAVGYRCNKHPVAQSTASQIIYPPLVHSRCYKRRRAGDMANRHDDALSVFDLASEDASGLTINQTGAILIPTQSITLPSYLSDGFRPDR